MAQNLPTCHQCNHQMEGRCIHPTHGCPCLRQTHGEKCLEFESAGADALKVIRNLETRMDELLTADRGGADPIDVSELMTAVTVALTAAKLALTRTGAKL